MSSVLKKEIHSTIAKSMYSGILNRTISAYFFLGRTLPWNETDTPDVADQSYAHEYDTRNHMITARRILNTEVSYAIPRVQWASGTIYDQYDDSYTTAMPAPSGATNLSEANMYVMNSDLNIYKCVSNNYGKPSTVQPSGTSLAYINSPDGYIWKYMMPISILSQNRFLSSEFMPIQNSITDSFYSPGLTPIIVDAGSGYVEGNTLITVTGDGINAHFEPVISGGQIVNVDVVNAGSGYTNAIVTVSSPDINKPQGTGAEIEVDLNTGDLTSSQSDVQLSAIDGEISHVQLVTNGSGYINIPDVTINGDGSGAEGYCVITDGSVTSVVLTDRGSGYTWAEATIAGPNGVDATARVIISPVGGHGHSIVEESYPRTLAFYMDTTEDTNQGIDSSNDYRQAGIFVNPDSYNTGGTRLLYNNDRASMLWMGTSSVDLTNIISKDDMITRSSDNEVFTVVEVDGVNVLLQTLNGSKLSDTDTFVDDNSITLFSLTSSIAPEVDKFSGTMLYIDNKPPYRETADQNVILKTYVQF